MAKPLCIYHHNCLDGFAAAWVFHSQADQKFDFHPGVYSNEPPDVTDRDVYLVDFSYKRPVVEKLLERARRVVLVDHHKTAIEDLRPLIESGRIEALVDLEHSGAMLAWKWFHGTTDTAPHLLWHVEDRDLWRFRMPWTREINASLFSYKYDFTLWDSLMQRPVDSYVVEGMPIERKHFKDVDELIEVTARELVIGGHRVPVANLPYTMSSDAGHVLAKGKPFAACYWDTPQGRVFSLRSTQGEGLDVSEIAKQYGGGGHRHAAGFRVPYGHELCR